MKAAVAEAEVEATARETEEGTKEIALAAVEAEAAAGLLQDLRQEKGAALVKALIVKMPSNIFLERNIREEKKL